MAEIVMLFVLLTLVVGAVLLVHVDGASGEREAHEWPEHDDRRPS
jgi:hypothetical protein